MKRNEVILRHTTAKAIMQVVGYPHDEMSLGNCLPMTEVKYIKDFGAFVQFEDMRPVCVGNVPVLLTQREVHDRMNGRGNGKRLRPDTAIIIGKRALFCAS